MNIGKILLVYLCMAIAVTIFFPQTVLDNAPNSNSEKSIVNVFNIYYNESSGEPVILSQSSFNDEDLNIATNITGEGGGLFSNIIETASSYYQSFIDGLKNIMGVLKILFKFLFSPLIFISDPDLMGEAPFYIKLIFALPLIFMGLIALVRFISGRTEG